MKINRWMQFAFILCCVFSLLGCHNKKATLYRPYDPSMDQPTEEAAPPTAIARGLGAESRFGEQMGSEAVMPHSHSDRVYYFAFDSTVIQENDRPAIVANARYLTAHPRARVLLEGHTDPRGSREYNIGLGERRAKAVADVLTSHGVRSAQIRIVSYGAEKLASPGHTESDYQQDRRVVLVYLQR